MVQESLVSIVLPIYNGEKYMRESIESVINQTYTNWELIIIDDCSTDSTPDIAKEYAAKDERIQYYRNEVNLKLPKGLNRGFSLAKGDYLTWTSDDNLYLSDALQVMLETIIKHKVGLVFAESELIDEEGKVTGKYEVPADSFVQRSAIFRYNCVGACFMYTREVYEEIGDYDDTKFYSEDYDYWFRVFAKFPVYQVKRVLYQYRNHSQSLSNTLHDEVRSERSEKSMIENVYQFGKLSLEEKYYYYSRLNYLRKWKKTKKEINHYRFRKQFYSVLYLFFKRISRKIKKIFLINNER